MRENFKPSTVLTQNFCSNAVASMQFPPHRGDWGVNGRVMLNLKRKEVTN